MKKIILCSLFLMSIGCKKATPEADPAESSRSSENSVEGLISSGSLHYAKDPNTGHCFAYGYMYTDSGQSSTGGPILTWVPCPTGIGVGLTGSVP